MGNKSEKLLHQFVLTLGTNKLLSLFDLIEREGVDAASKEWI